MDDEVDLIFLSRDLSPPRPDVRRGVEVQTGVRLRIHRVVGTPRPSDPNRWETIARARNEARARGAAPWVMLLDDDVVLGPGCVARLVDALRRRPGFAALGADSAGEMGRTDGAWDTPAHVGMAAALFRRERLTGLTFRWEPGKCECRCCCDDLRRAGYGIGYVPGAPAWHRPASQGAHLCTRAADGPTEPSAPGRVLAAFDRRDYLTFRRLFLPSFRRAGNRALVTAVAYGLYPSELVQLRSEPGVEVVSIAPNDVCPSIRRLRDFQDVIARWPASTPVAYWDAGDVLFQSRLDSLWELVRSHPDRLLVARDTVGYDESPVVVPWIQMIRDPASRRRAFALLSKSLFLNSGFAAGTAASLMGYLRAGDRLINSEALRGVDHWGDQLALNLYCHSHPDAWREISPAWNYCLACRRRNEYRRRPDGRFEGSDGSPVHVVHGNARTLSVSALPMLV